jgi:hypothetical protein
MSDEKVVINLINTTGDKVGLIRREALKCDALKPLVEMMGTDTDTDPDPDTDMEVGEFEVPIATQTSLMAIKEFLNYWSNPINETKWVDIGLVDNSDLSKLDEPPSPEAIEWVYKFPIELTHNMAEAAHYIGISGLTNLILARWIARLMTFEPGEWLIFSGVPAPKFQFDWVSMAKKFPLYQKKNDDAAAAAT